MAEATVPADATAMIRFYLDQLATLESQNLFARILRDEGRPWRVDPRVVQPARAEPRQCFANAQKTVLTGKRGATYVEGFACTGTLGFPLPIHHAWLVDEEGRVLDPTWDVAGSTYWGIAFETRYVRRIVDRTQSHCALLLNHMDDYALLRREDERRRAFKAFTHRRGIEGEMEATR